MSGIHSPILDHTGKPIVKPVRRSGMRARYDAAQTTPLNERHWAAADTLGPNAAASPEIRRRLISRSRYEADNNSYLRGMLETLAGDVVGTGPRLQMLTRNQTFNQAIEDQFVRWSKRTRLPHKLRTATKAKARDGEAFAFAITNDRLVHPVKLDIRLRECDQITSPTFGMGEQQNEVDGVRLDENGQPLAYWLLDSHPGGEGELRTINPMEGEWIRSEFVAHWFREDRPGQVRGIPETAPALSLFALLRNYVLAVVHAAETAADLAGVMFTSSPHVDTEDAEPLDEIELAMRSLLTLPKGWQMAQMKAEQPTTTMPDFVKTLLNEIARVFLMPFNIAAGNSAGYNFASARLDHLVWWQLIDILREEIECIFLEWIFDAWLSEAVITLDRIFGPDFEFAASLPHRWQWPVRRPIDQVKEASSAQILWQIGLLTDADHYMEQGKDPEAQYQAHQEGLSRRRELGLPTPGGAATNAQTEPETEAVTSGE